MKLKVKETFAKALNALRPKTWLFSLPGNATYEGNAYIGFPTTDSDNYDNTTVTCSAGLITINKKGTYLVNAHVGTQTVTSNRGYLRLKNYDNGYVLAQSIFYGTWATCTMSKVIKVTTTPCRLGVQAVEKVNINSGGIGPSYFQVTQVGGVLRNPVISRLTAIFTSRLFGGDVDEDHSQKAVDEGTGQDKNIVRLASAADSRGCRLSQYSDSKLVESAERKALQTHNNRSAGMGSIQFNYHVYNGYGCSCEFESNLDNELECEYRRCKFEWNNICEGDFHKNVLAISERRWAA